MTTSMFKSLLSSVFSVNISEDERFLQNGQYLGLTVSSAGPSLHVYINGELNGWYFNLFIDFQAIYYEKLVSPIPLFSAFFVLN